MTPRTPSSPNRVVTTLTGGIPDVPPLALSLAMQASRTTGRSAADLLRDAPAFVDAQLQMHERWQHDIAIGMLYGAVEAEAFGADVLFFDDGPPNAGAPVVRDTADLRAVAVPDIASVPALTRTLDVIRGMKAELTGRALVAGVCIGPLSGPVMLLGMPAWLDLVMTRPDDAAHLADLYRTFALDWARAQLEAGIGALIWFEPLLSPELVPHPRAQALALPALTDAVALGAPVVLHLASARAVGVVDTAVEAGAAILSIGRFDDPDTLRARSDGRITLIGPIDGISMAHWSPDDAIAAARAAREQFDRPGGWIASDAHGEIPWNVDPATLDALVHTLRQPR